MKKILLILSLSLVGMQITPAASSMPKGASYEVVTYSVNKAFMQELIRTLWNEIYHDAIYLPSSSISSKSESKIEDEIINPIFPAVIEGEIDKNAIKQIDINEIRTFLKNLFDLTWDDIYVQNEQLQENPPITPRNEKTLAVFKEHAKALVIGMFIENVVGNTMNSCECIPMADRISYSFILADDIRKKFPDPKQRIVITSFASGLLLQEYLLLTLLKKYGYTNIALNLVDLGYPDPISLQRIIKQTGPENAKRAIKHYKHEVIRAAGLQGADPDEKYKWINENKTLFPELAELIDPGAFDSGYGYQKALEHLKELVPNVTVNTFRNMHEYIDLAQKRPDLKADVITIVDPDLNVFDIAPFPSQANMVGITDKTLFDKQDPQYKPHVFVTVAKDFPSQVYVHLKTYTDAQKTDAPFIQKINDLIKSARFIEEHKDHKATFKPYKAKFRDWIITTFGSAYDKETLKELLNKNEQLLNDAQDNKIEEIQLNTLLDELLTINEAIFEKTNHLDQNKLNALYATYKTLTPANKITIATAVIKSMNKLLNKIENDQYQLVWYSDPHLAFQELVRQTAKDDAIIYLYYQDDPQELDRPFILERVSKDDYISRDVFGPNVGRMLMQVGIDEEDELPFEDKENNETEYESYHEIEIDPNDLYGRVDLKNGNILTWDDLKDTFPNLNDLRVPKVELIDYTEYDDDETFEQPFSVKD
ncbi:MAG: hypothetical protein WD055_03015 [Candidatus Dependentiae bacterium]